MPADPPQKPNIGNAFPWHEHKVDGPLALVSAVRKGPKGMVDTERRWARVTFLPFAQRTGKLVNMAQGLGLGTFRHRQLERTSGPNKIK